MASRSKSLERMRRHAIDIFRAALHAVDPDEAIRRHVRLENHRLSIGDQRFELTNYDRVLVVGAGKAGAPMARALEDVLGNHIKGGLVVVKEGHALPLRRIRIHEASHPVPDQRGIRGTEAILSLLADTTGRDLVICVISGGGSALLVAPAEGIALDDKQEITRLLLACGADIHEINKVRKHLSRVKGGGLARAANPATTVSLILSDVIGDDLNAIASGPTVPDPSTFSDARAVLTKYGIWDQVPDAVRKHIDSGVAGQIEDTAKPGAPLFDRCFSMLIGSNSQALQAAGMAAKTLGYRTLILSSTLEGEARLVANDYAAMAKRVQSSGDPVSPPACMLLGGETTVTLSGDGVGGRNQEFALAASMELAGEENIVVLCGGTDGTDGPTDAAGAIADGTTLARARDQGLDPADYLRRNDSYRFFRALGDLIVTGPTRTNVMDIYLFLIRRTAS